MLRILKIGPRCMTREETLARVERGASLSRYGDGEIVLTGGIAELKFQRSDAALTRRLAEVIRSEAPGHLVCLPGFFEEHPAPMLERAEAFNKAHLRRFRWAWVRFTRRRRTYGNTYVTRLYIDTLDRAAAARMYARWKRFWQGRDIVFIEGERSRLGVGNDLFDGAASIRRILGPAENAFSCYDELLAQACKIEKDALILIALGPTATVLAYDLHRAGYQAIDIGHIDIEYEWFRMGAARPVAIPGKYVNEAQGGDAVGGIDDPAYLSQVIARVA